MPVPLGHGTHCSQHSSRTHLHVLVRSPCVREVTRARTRGLPSAERGSRQPHGGRRRAFAVKSPWTSRLMRFIYFPRTRGSDSLRSELMKLELRRISVALLSEDSELARPLEAVNFFRLQFTVSRSFYVYCVCASHGNRT